MNLPNLPRAIVFLAPLACLVAIGCIVGDLDGDSPPKPTVEGQSTGEPCADDPFKCKAGTTCWPTSESAANCVPSKEYKTKGSECELLFGRSSCADNLVCITVNKPLDAGPDTGKDVGVQPTSEPYSICATWCDDKHPCAAGEECKQLSLDGYSARACVPNNLTPPDTGIPDTAPPDTNRPDTYKPDTGADTAVTDSAKDSAVDTSTPEDTSPPEDSAPPADTSSSADTSSPADASSD